MKADSMLRTSAIITIIVLMLAVSASAIPPLPSEFYGSVSINSAPAPAGTVIEAKISGESRGTVTTEAVGVYGGSSLFDSRLVVSATEEDIEGGDPEISFYIGGSPADQTAIFQEGTTRELDLSTGGAVQIVADFSGTPTSGTAPLTVQFTDLSTGGPTMWAWDFGDGGTDMVADPLHTYASPGIYTVTLTASSQYSGSDTLIKAGYITVTDSSQIVADFSGTPTSGTAPLTVQFTDLSTGGPTMWAWDFGDGGTDMVADPLHTYTNPGIYTVTLTASSQYSGSDTLVKAGYITVTDSSQIVADFSGTPTSGTAPLTVQFTDLSTGGPTMWAWDFGDGGTDMVADPLHTYTSPGIYTVTLTASSQYSGSDTQVKAGYITVDGGGGPTAAFSAEPTGGKSPLTVSFTDLSTGSPISWTWDFGDETGSSEQNPVHTYETANLYTVTLTVTNSQGADTLEMEDYISVSGDVPPPAAVFTADPRTGDAPLTVQFTDMSPGTPRWWLWKFGDGDSSTEKNPVHTYSQTGSYDVYLKVGNSGGADSTLMPGFITVTGTGTIVADFSGTPVYGEKPLTVQFTDLSTGGPTMWAWDFGDGGTDMIADPLHTYTEAGIYSVTLTASSQYGSDTITKTGYITVIEQGGIVADFSGTPTCGEKPLTVQFTDLSTGSPTMWAWDFGDGGTAMVADPHYTYTEAGIYTVTLTASSQITGTDTIVKAGYITVTEQGGIVADFSGSPTTGEAPLTVQFTDTSTGTPTMWAWNFGDGGTAMVANPAHTYTGEGVYTVSLTASSQITGTDTIVKPGYITVTKPGSEGVISVSSTPGGAEVYIDDEYIGITPVTKTGLSYGAHRVRISLEGYKPWEKTVYPLPGKPVEIQAVLEPSGHETGSINIQLAPQWSTVYLNGLEQGQTKQSVPFILSNLQEGTYEIKVTRPGFEDYQNRVPVYSGQTTKIYVRMTQKPGSEPGIMIDSIPRGGAVTVDGSAVGTTPLVVPGISKGEHTVKVTMDGYFDWQQGVTVTSGKTSYVTAVLYPEFWSPSAGYMMVTSLPGTATLSVDGVLAGQSPMTLSAVSPGDHLVRLELESYEPWEQMVTVREGKTSYVIARMTQ